MKAYRIVTRERAVVKHEYYIEADSPEEARRMVLEPEEDQEPESVASEIDEYTGEIYITSITEIKKEDQR